MADEDYKLVESFLDGNEGAFNKIVYKYQQKIYWHARRMIGNRLDADEITQEVLIVLYKKLKLFKFKSSLYTWLYRVATNVALGKLRKKKNIDDFRSYNNIEFENISSLQIADWPDHLEEKFDTEEFRKCLEKAMDELPDHYRTVFILRDLEGHSTRNTAKILEISEANVKVRLMRARLYLRDQMAYHLKCVNRGDYGKK